MVYKWSQLTKFIFESAQQMMTQSQLSSGRSLRRSSLQRRASPEAFPGPIGLRLYP